MEFINFSDLEDTFETECMQCDRCEKEIGLCPLYNGSNGSITWMGLNNIDLILEMKRNR